MLPVTLGLRQALSGSERMIWIFPHLIFRLYSAYICRFNPCQDWLRSIPLRFNLTQKPCATAGSSQVILSVADSDKYLL